MKRIRLTQGKFAIVDDEDYGRLTEHGWCALRAGVNFYAAHSVRPARGAKTVTVRMHRAVMNAQPGQIVDHKNHDTLDNRKENLRIVSNSQNMMNRSGPRRRTAVGIRGVTLHSGTGKYRAMIRVSGKLISLGLYETSAEAAVVYAAANKKHFKEYGGL